MFVDKTILVSGCTSGIGYAIAKKFAHEKTNIILNGLLPQNEVSTIIEEMSNLTTGKVIYERVDLTNVLEIEKLFDRLAQQNMMPDILVNNAGVQHVSPIEAFAKEKWDHIIALNLSAAFHTIRHSLPFMRQKGWGRIVNIASAHGLVGSPHKVAYISAKHGLVGLTKVVALETALDHITVNAICPGWVLTPLVQQQLDEKMKAQGISLEQAKHELLFEKHPTLQFVRPEDIADLVFFLCSESAHQVTGASWTIDGGWTCR